MAKGALHSIVDTVVPAGKDSVAEIVLLLAEKAAAGRCKQFFYASFHIVKRTTFDRAKADASSKLVPRDA